MCNTLLCCCIEFPLGIPFPSKNSLFHDCNQVETTVSCSHQHQLTASLPSACSLLTFSSQAI